VRDSGRSTGGALPRILATACILALAAGAAAGTDGAPDGVQAGAGTPPAAAVTDERDEPDADPWQGMNRAIFWFNDQVDVYVLEPVARGWRWATPGPMRTGISNFFQNLRFPIVFVNETFQAKPFDALRTFARFGINTTLGIAGFLDPAAEFGLEPTAEDFGQTLGVWGVPSGPYLVLPLLGPSNVRDTGGLAVDTATTIIPFFVDTLLIIGPRLIDVVNTRARFLDEVEEAKAASFDYYVAVRHAYQQRRRAEIDDRGREAGEEFVPDEDLYRVVEP